MLSLDSDTPFSQTRTASSGKFCLSADGGLCLAGELSESSGGGAVVAGAKLDSFSRHFCPRMRLRLGALSEDYITRLLDI